jgi:hypothetical protein
MTGDDSSAVGPSSDSAAVPEDLDLRVTTLEDRLASLERGAAAIWGAIPYAARRCHIKRADAEPPPKEENEWLAQLFNEPGFFESLPDWLRSSHCEA